MTAALRRPSLADRSWLRTWLTSVARAAGHAGDVNDLLHRREGCETRIIERDGAAVGIICWHRTRGSRDARFELVATPPDQARRGVGMRAAAMVERELGGAGVRRIYVPASAAHGISMYFWVRLGYRPLMRSDWPCAVEGVAWLVRDL